MPILNDLESNTEVIIHRKYEVGEIVIWLSTLDVLFLITIMFVSNINEIVWYVDAFLLVCMFIQATIICLSLPGKNNPN
jgi:hypothetical protein